MTIVRLKQPINLFTRHRTITCEFDIDAVDCEFEINPLIQLFDSDPIRSELDINPIN